jgi:hypothetical protein
VTISKDELAEIARSDYPEAADEHPRRAAEAVGLFVSDTIACTRPHRPPVPLLRDTPCCAVT